MKFIRQKLKQISPHILPIVLVIISVLLLVFLPACGLQERLEERDEAQKEIVENYTAVWKHVAEDARVLTYQGHDYIVVKGEWQESGVGIIHSESCSGRH